jgi:hypothetical protein
MYRVSSVQIGSTSLPLSPQIGDSCSYNVWCVGLCKALTLVMRTLTNLVYSLHDGIAQHDCSIELKHGYEQQAPAIPLQQNDQGAAQYSPFISESPMEECSVWDLGVGL